MSDGVWNVAAIWRRSVPAGGGQASIVFAVRAREHPLGAHTRPRYSRPGVPPSRHFAESRRNDHAHGTMIGLWTTKFPLASELPLPQLPMSALLRAVVRLRLTGLGYKRIARELDISRDRARDYARTAHLGGVRGDAPPGRARSTVARPRSCAHCGAAIALRRRGRPARFCSRPCRDAARYAARKRSTQQHAATRTIGRAVRLPG